MQGGERVPLVLKIKNIKFQIKREKEREKERRKEKHKRVKSFVEKINLFQVSVESRLSPGAGAAAGGWEPGEASRATPGDR